MPYKRGVFSNPSTAAAVPIYMNNPPTSHSAEHWDTASILPLPTVASVSAGVALTTSQCYKSSPFYGQARIYDVYVTYTATSAGTIKVDLYNATTNGSSYLLAPFTLTASASAFTFASARASGLLPINSDPVLDGLYWRTTAPASNKYSLSQGGIFSVRAQTPASTGSITDLRVKVVLISTDNSSFLEVI